MPQKKKANNKIKQTQKQNQKQNVIVNINTKNNKETPKRQYTKRNKNNNVKTQKYNPGLDSGTNKSFLGPSTNPPIIQQSDPTTSALLTSLLNSTLNSNNQSSFFPSRNDTQDRSIFRARESMIPQMPDTPINIRHETVKPIDIKPGPPPPPPPPPKSLVQEIKPKVSKPDPSAQGYDAVLQELKYKTSDEGKAEKAEKAQRRAEKQARNNERTIDSDEGTPQPQSQPQSQPKSKQSETKKEKEEGQSLLEFLGGTPAKKAPKARVTAVHKPPEQKLLTYGEAHIPDFIIYSPPTEAMKKQMEEAKQIYDFNTSKIQGAIRRKLIPQKMENTHGEEMRKNKKKYQSLISEHTTRKTQPEKDVNYAQSAIDYYDRNIIKKKVGRPRLEPNYEILPAE